VNRRKQNTVSESQTNLPLKSDEKSKLSPELDLLIVGISFGINANAISCLLSISNFGLALHAMHGHPHYRADIDKIFPGIIPPFLQVLELEKPKLVAGLREDERKAARAALYAAALIYSHAILEDVLVRLCELSIKQDSQPWLAIISDRKVAVRDAISKSIDDVKAEALERYAKDFERFTLLDKCQALLGVLRPKTCRRVVPKYNFSLSKLQQLDSLRHDMVHQTKFGATKGRLRDQHDYLLKTAQFFIALTQRKYNFKPLPSEKDVDFEMLDAVCAAQLEVLAKTKASGQEPIA
jgi:hypothetical protein